MGNTTICEYWHKNGSCSTQKMTRDLAEVLSYIKSRKCIDMLKNRNKIIRLKDEHL